MAAVEEGHVSSFDGSSEDGDFLELRDDFTVVTMTEENSAWLEGWVVGQLSRSLGIAFSTKNAASVSFAEVSSAIGAKLDTRGALPQVLPNPLVVKKLRDEKSH